GSTAATNNSPSRIAVINDFGIGLWHSSARIGRVNYELTGIPSTSVFFPVEIVGQGQNIWIDGITINNSPSGAAGIVDMQFAGLSVNPSRNNSILFGQNQTSLASGAGVAADIHISSVAPNGVNDW